MHSIIVHKYTFCLLIHPNTLIFKMINFKTSCILAIFIVLVIGCNQAKNERFDNQKKSLSENIGEKFELVNVLDSSGNEVLLNYTNSEFTIIDFWNNSCPPCIEEMKQFSVLLKGKEHQVSVISISVNQFWLWKPTLTLHTGRFSFINNNTPNWTHFVLHSNQDAKLKNEFSIDRIEELERDYNVAFFPAYFVLDRNGIIKSRPESAVEFIKSLN